ncbi:hypothetical protein [Sorangium sp. So ce1000]|uniref:hypothetical protein n=1 Tax=Sorangium sp. So ce1000 TaxID=3133325 RepID=UPI003F611CF1
MNSMHSSLPGSGYDSNSVRLAIRHTTSVPPPPAPLTLPPPAPLTLPPPLPLTLPPPLPLALPPPLPPPVPAPPPLLLQLGSVRAMFAGTKEASAVVEKWNENDEPGRTDTFDVLEYVHVDPDCVWAQPASS